jgi:two-component system sensor histidine kinase BaeS
MRWTIGKRLFAALTIASLVILGLNAAASRWSFERGFVAYLAAQEEQRLADVAQALSVVYQRDAGWQKITENPRRWEQLFRDSASESHRAEPPPRPGGRSSGGNRRPPPRGDHPPPDPLALGLRVALADVNGEVLIGRPPNPQSMDSLAIMSGGIEVGRLLVERQRQLTQQVDVRFANEQVRSIFYIAAAALLIAALIALMIARQIVRPIRALADGAHALTDGDYDKRITVARDDELGDLASDFNRLANTLDKNQQSRRQWVSDIAHELRTPLSILLGELQAIEDGIREFDDGTRKSMQAEVQRLGKLVADLHDLTTSDEGGLSYHRELLNVVDVLADVIATNQPRISDAGMQLQTNLPSASVGVYADASRLEQLFTNVIENSLRYTDQPGDMTIRCAVSGQHVSIEFADSAPGVAPAERQHLFDRLYRVDASRSRATGGSGLGLSICQAIVAAHDGSIAVDASELGGLAVIINLPMAVAEDLQS